MDDDLAAKLERLKAPHKGNGAEAPTPKLAPITPSCFEGHHDREGAFGGV